jgi:Photosynthetic reaction centre cytochrome C subunit
LKLLSLLILFPLALIACAVLTTASPPAHSQRSTDAASSQTASAPSNLKVLPGNLTESQVRDIMEQWESDLGTDCSTCHVKNPNDLAPNGRPRFNFAADLKQEKATARVMYTMVQEINGKFLAQVPNSGLPVTCGTCHRGHLSPEPFTGAGDSPVAPANAAPASSH